MESLNQHIQEYTDQLSKGHIQKAYRGIMTFMADLKSDLERIHPDWVGSTLYVGYMDMTYFACTPPALRDRKLKVAIVYLHESGSFEVWLAGNNRRVQAEYIGLLKDRDIGELELSQVQPGVDSIVVSVITERPDFDHPEKLKELIEGSTVNFANDILAILG
jgi:hypothetical protein